MKQERVEIEKTKLAGSVPLEAELLDLLSVVNGTVLDINGGIGRISEYLSEKGCDVTLLEPNRLSFAYRKSIVPDSKVTKWNIEPESIKLSKPAYDYVIIRSTYHYDLAKKIAKIGVVNLITMEIENVVSSAKKPTASSEAKRTTGSDEKSQSSDIQPIVPKTPTENPSVSNSEPLVDLE